MPALRSALGNVSEGPQRWIRARENAEARPNSSGAKLYRRREGIAAELKQAFFAHQKQAFTVLRGTGMHHQDVRKINVCSVECLGFQMQLDVGERPPQRVGIEQYKALVSEALAANGAPATYTWRPDLDRGAWTRSLVIQTLDKTTLLQPVTCRVCGVKITGDRTEVKNIAAATEAQDDKHKWVITPNGRMYAVAELRVVRLTDDESVILSEYSTDELRAVFAADFGYSLTEDVK